MVLFPLRFCSGPEELLGKLEPADVLALLLVEGDRVDEVTDLVAHSGLREVLVKGLLQGIVEILEFGAIVATDVVLFLNTAEALHIADDVAVCLLALLRAAVEGHPRATLLVLHSDAKVRGLLLDAILLAFSVGIRIKWARELPLYPHDLVTHLSLEHHVHVPLSLNQLKLRCLQELTYLLGLLVLLLLVLDLRLQSLHHLLYSAGKLPNRCWALGGGTRHRESLEASCRGALHRQVPPCGACQPPRQHAHGKTSTYAHPPPCT
mmetsp:Transcript_84609/g.196730  ORF Transcript_84609/g.196730 Transcript_84609/m.196730 type:complete len:264 (-) Transcript_84609:11-802(-)